MGRMWDAHANRRKREKFSAVISHVQSFTFTYKNNSILH